jgi:predicted anti-sigma-YlaC factor YlaD
MKCEDFRGLTDLGTPEALEHLRNCDECMNFAAEQDGANFFRALGGEEMIPPGGVEAFVSDVMREVQLRDKQRQWSRQHHLAPWSRWSAAAAAAVLVASLSFFAAHRPMMHVPTGVGQVASVQTVPTVSRPVVEAYDNGGATIMEVPTDSTDAKIVMVFDESLPADL